MTHPHSDWDRAALERYIGTTEALTLEFKSHRALLADGKRTRSDRVFEASRDVAGMANEQGGTIIYGIEESGGTGFRIATAVGEGFSATDKVDREWFIQVMRDHISPPLTELDVAQIDLDGSHVALVVLVPQSRGVARQTDDLYFPRRDAQGLHNMTVQEIQDVGGRTERPDLDLLIRSGPGQLNDGSGFEVRANFDIANTSQVTANFAVVTIGFVPPDSMACLVEGAWRPLQAQNDWAMNRSVIASGSSPLWSPITPGFTLPTEGVVVRVSKITYPEGSWRTVGLARLDHDGGSRVYRIDFGPQAGLVLRLQPFPGDTGPTFVEDKHVPELFLLPA